ncbi:hypothetical protein Agub_g15007, partial [Astrephomene gubernaculifera]
GNSSQGAAEGKDAPPAARRAAMAAAMVAAGVVVEVLESPFVLADLADRLSPASYEPLLRAYRTVVEARAATQHLATSGWQSHKSLGQPNVKSLNLRAHHTHMGSLLRWAA